MRTERLAVERDLETYLRRLRFSLAPLPVEEREEIVREIRSHFLEQIGDSPDPAVAFRDTAAAMGMPEDYARSFLDDYRITVAVAGGSGLVMLHEALRIAGRGIRALAGFAFFLLVFTLAFAFVLLALLKPIFPENVGAWFAPEQGVVGLGFVDAETAARAPDLLGYWIVPLSIVIGVLLYRLGTALLRRFLRSLQTTLPARQ